MDLKSHSVYEFNSHNISEYHIFVNKNDSIDKDACIDDTYN